MFMTKFDEQLPDRFLTIDMYLLSNVAGSPFEWALKIFFRELIWKIPELDLTCWESLSRAGWALRNYGYTEVSIIIIVSRTSVPIGLVAKKNQIQVVYNNPDHLKLYFKFANTHT